jgi:putative ABC transport system permease protein
MRTPLAWKNLTHNWRRLLLALGGVGFAVLLMCMQLAFENALFNSTVALVHHFNADLIVTSAAKYTIVVREPFKRQRLFQALACDEVASAVPFYIETQLALVTNQENLQGVPIRVLAFNPNDDVLDLNDDLKKHRDQLRLPFRGLYDIRSKDGYGIDVKELQAKREALKVADGVVDLVGGFKLGTDFANDGNLIVSASTYLALFPQRASGEDGLDDVDIGLIKLKKDHPSPAEVIAVQKKLSEILPKEDVKVQTKKEFEIQEHDFWASSTPIGFIFWLGTLMGFVVGMVICYQILYSDIADHLPEFATLKAMGYRNGYFVGVVLQEAVLLSFLGFLPGLLCAELVCLLVAWKTHLEVTVIDPWIITKVLGLSLVMCVISGSMTIRKVMSADPAELFK